MITCSNCTKSFSLDLDQIKGGEIACPYCHHNCSINLYELQEAYEKNSFSGFQAMTGEKEIVTVIPGKEESESASNLIFHLNLLLALFIFIINLFTLGLTQLDNLKAFPVLESFYKAMGINSRKHLMIEEIILNQKEKSLKINFENISGKREILNQIRIIFYDLYAKEKGDLILEPFSIIQPGKGTFTSIIPQLASDIEFCLIQINDAKLSYKVTVIS